MIGRAIALCYSLLMKFFLSTFFVSLFLMACASSSVPASETVVAEEGAYPRDEHGEVLAFDDEIITLSVIDDVVAETLESNKKGLIVMGTNRCHDSRALATHFEKPRFKSLIEKEYVLRYVDVGWKEQNLHIANHFGLDGIKGTPTVIILDSAGEVLNLEDAPTWRNAASREEDDVYEYFKDHAEK